MSAARVLRSYSDLVEIIRARIVELEIAYDVLDDAAGLQSGYTAKLLAPVPIRRMSPWTQFLLFDALGLSCEVRVDPRQTALMRNRLTKRRAKRVMRSPAGIVQMTPDLIRQNGRKGGFSRAKSLTAKQRSKLARRAAVARWKLEKRKAATAAQPAQELGPPQAHSVGPPAGNGRASAP